MLIRHQIKVCRGLRWRGEKGDSEFGPFFQVIWQVREGKDRVEEGGGLSYALSLGKDLSMSKC